MTFDIVTHADWSVSAKKRWAVTAKWSNGRWTVDAPAPAMTAISLLELAKTASVLAGFDFPIGVPTAWGTQTELSGFKEGLAVFGKERWARFYDVAEVASEITLERPFYPRVSSNTARQVHLIAAHGVSNIDALRRQCEHSTADRRAACPLFWTLGGNQVGKAALTGWREVVVPCLISGARLWPFDGSLSELQVAAKLVIAETYPAEAYGYIGASFAAGESKRRQADRKGKAQAIQEWAARFATDFSPDLLTEIIDGFGPEKEGEDKFDALAGLCGMLDVVDGRREDGAPDDETTRIWEGWILGQKA